jgi:tRNA (guanine26-N2/guanine27-N2)-dimethyltransferase
MIEEREVRLELEPEDEPTKESDVFYNDDMVLNRDVSVAALEVYRRDQDDGLRILDALAGSGIRGLRYWKELGEGDGTAVESVTVNDANPKAVENIRENLRLNDAEEIGVEEKDATLLLAENYRGYDFVDIDPFGSPAPFMDATVRGLHHEGFAGFTATDLATLCGTYRKACRRRYASWSLNTSYCHEIGLRVLMKLLFESFARFDKVFRPKVAFAQKHYYRVLGEVRESKKYTNRMLDSIGYLRHCDECLYRKLVEEPEQGDCPECGSHLHILGPLWIGELGREGYCERTAAVLEERGYEEAYEVIDTLADEVGIKTPYYDTHMLAKSVGLPSPRKEQLIEALNERGYRTVETHFAPTGIRTNAPIADVKEFIREMKG